MPNDCWNNITIKATFEQINAMLENEFRNVPSWAYQTVQSGRELLVFRIWSPNAPCEEFIDKLLKVYIDIWIKDEWSEEGGHAGVIVGKHNALTKFSWYEGPIEEWHARLMQAGHPNPRLAP
jgi:hypothetical protein